MFLRNLKYAMRSLWRDKFYTLLNGTGLAIGMAVAMLLFLWVNDELSFDNFHQKKDRIYRVLAKWNFAGEDEVIDHSPAPLAIAARDQVSEIEEYVRLYNLWNTVFKYGDQKYGIEDAFLADSNFFEIFDFEFITGNKASALAAPHNVVISNSLANRIFGTTDVIGQPLNLAGVMDLKVSAVIEDIPSNSHLQFDCLIPFESNYRKFMGEGSLHWGACNFNSYVLLRPNINPISVDDKLSAAAAKNEDGSNSAFSFQLQALPDIYLNSGFIRGGKDQYGNKETIRLMGIIGVLILFIACINYVNLATARSAHRAKSTGVKKIVGANRWHLFSQYIVEAFVLVTIATLVAAAIANLSLGLLKIYLASILLIASYLVHLLYLYY